ncbi:MAG: radical SAM family heme chaperone HemW [Candidatus Firestonebacteria bacterium]
MRGLYIHIPFCFSKCYYCDFNSYSNFSSDFKKKYCETILNQLQQILPSLCTQGLGSYSKIDTIYIGGGTPTSVEIEQLCNIVKCCKQYFGADENIEITVEANPVETGCNQSLQQLKEAGVNRLSIGAQTFNDDLLKWLGRIHSSKDFFSCYNNAREVGFDNINVDLIFGVVNQTQILWQDTLKRLVGYSPEHISLYDLTIEEGSKFYGDFKKGKYKLLTDDERFEMYDYAIKFLSDNGYEHYEISNFAKPGFSCKHNEIYWKNEEYIGLGAGAWSYLEGKRFSNIRDPYTYVDCILNSKEVVEYLEDLPLDKVMSESIILGLRMMRGIDKNNWKIRFKEDIKQKFHITIEELKNLGLLYEDDSKICLTSKGIRVANEVFVRFV